MLSPTIRLFVELTIGTVTILSLCMTIMFSAAEWSRRRSDETIADRTIEGNRAMIALFAAPTIIFGYIWSLMWTMVVDLRSTVDPRPLFPLALVGLALFIAGTIGWSRTISPRWLNWRFMLVLAALFLAAAHLPFLGRIRL